MASTIKIKNSTTTGSAPSSLSQGELAINVADGNLFYGNGSSVKQNFVVDELEVKGNLTAQQYIVSSSVIYTTQSFSSGSTAFGDSADDTHTFTGNITASNNISASGTITANSFTGNGLSIDGSSNAHIEVGEYSVGFDTLGLNTLFITGSGLIVSGAMADANHHNMVKIGNVELIDLNTAVSTNEFLIHNVNSFKITSGSDGGEIAGSGQLFEHNGTDFKLYRNNSAVITANATTTTFTNTNVEFIADAFFRAPVADPGTTGHFLFTTTDPTTAAKQTKAIIVGDMFKSLTGAVTASAVSASGTIVGSNLSGTNTGDQDLSGFLSSSSQIASDISGSFTAASASFSTRVTANDAKLTANTSNVTTAGALMDSELAEIATVKALTAASISGSFTAASASFSTRVTANDAKVTANTANVQSALNNQDLDLGSGNLTSTHITASGTVSASRIDASIGNLIFDGVTSVTTTTPKGEIIKYGTATSAVTAGSIYRLNADGNWFKTDADFEISSSGLLGVAVSSNAADGFLIRGICDLIVATTTPTGSTLYLSTTNGRATSTPTSGSGDVIRAVGYNLNGGSQAYFNPDGTYIVAS